MLQPLRSPAWQHGHVRARRRAACAAALVCVISACASNPAARRATLIADADRSAKAAIENESRLDVNFLGERTFAVLPFAVSSSDTLLRPLGYGLASLLVTDLSSSPQLRMVERLQMDALLRELKLSQQGITDTTQAPRVGKLVGARRVLLGEITQLAGGSIRLSARVVDVGAGTVQSLVAADAPLDRVLDAEKALALLILERLGIVLTPGERLRVERNQTTQLSALVAYGRGVQADARGDAAGATAAFAEAARLDASFLAARTQLSAAASGERRASSVARVLDLATQAINASATAKTSDVAEAPLASGSTVPLVVVVRVLP
jgi:TolB-like protein